MLLGEVMKQEVFSKELSYIKNEEIKKSLEVMLSYVPDYFFVIPATSTGKYHPMYAQGEGGLLRHTKAAVRMAIELYGIYKFDERQKDLMIMSLVLHDSVKKGIEETKYTLFEHPLVACDFIKMHSAELLLTKEDISFVCDCISSHMGRFNTSDYSDVILPLPKTPEQKFVHMCDYLASRKVIHLEFDQNNNILED